MVKVPLKEEEIFVLFNESENGSREGKICHCFCNCDELEPPPRVRNISSFLHFSPQFIKKSTSTCFKKRK